MSNPGTNAIRSPSYPNMSLAEAVAAVRKIEEQYRMAKVDRLDGAKLIGYSSLSGPANKALAALAQYGLVERAGKGEMRVTERARAILHSSTNGEKLENLKWAAMEPSLFRELGERFPNMTPPEDGVITYLNRQGFNRTAVRPAAKAYLETLLYLREMGASESHGNEQSRGADSEEPDEEDDVRRFGGAKVGDLIQWEVSGALQMEKPMKVRLVTEDGKWVAVEGSETGIPMEQVIVEKPASESPTLPPTFAIKQLEEKGPTGTRKAIFPTDDGDVALIYPDGISANSLKDLGDYLDIFLKKQREKMRKAGDEKG